MGELTTFIFMKVVENTDEFRSLAESDNRFCALFTADWCPDCLVLKAVLPGLEKDFENRFVFATVDRDKFPDLVAEYDILGIPSFISFHKGEVTGTFISKLRKTRHQIVDYLEETYAKS